MEESTQVCGMPIRCTEKVFMNGQIRDDLLETSLTTKRTEEE